MKLVLLLQLLVSPYLFAYQDTINCKSEFFESQWRPYQSARQYVQSLGIKTSRQFQKWSHSGQRPIDIPSNPFKVYKSEWNGWGEFLGTGNVNKKKFRDYESAKEHIQSLGIKTYSQYKEWSRSGARPNDIPSNPFKVYKSEWNGWGEFLGTGNVNKKKFRDYESAKEHIQNLGIKTYKQFQEWSRSGQRPADIPSNPFRIYETEWNGWGAFLGTGNVSKKNFRSYRSTQILVQSVGISSREKFLEWSRSGGKPDDIPFNPNQSYKSEWISWSEFLGRKKPKRWMSYRKGQQYVQQMNIRTVKEFLKWLKSSKRPEDFPPDPHIVWSDLWKSTQDFLKIEWVSFQKARAYVQLGNITEKSAYYEFRELKDLINELPPNPAVVYAPYWKSWDDFLLYYND